MWRRVRGAAGGGVDDSVAAAQGTNIGGEWDVVFARIKRNATTRWGVHGMGAPRITMPIKVGTRTDREQTMEEKVRSVEKLLEE